MPTHSFNILGEAAIGANQTGEILIAGNESIIAARAYAKTAPTGAGLIFDINKNGTTIWSTQGNRVTIAATANEATAQTAFNTTSLAANDNLSIDIDQIGSTIAGADITVFLETVGEWELWPGMMMWWPNSAMPHGGWLAADGSAVSQTTYARLYAVYGADKFGTDSGGNFFLPDLRGRGILGSGTGAGLTARTLASTGGVEAIDEVPPHTHAIHGIDDDPTTSNFDLIDGFSNGGAYTTAPDALRDGPINNTGTGIAAGNVDIMNPFLVLNPVIKT